jgi:site-specific recombinase XerD
MEDEPRYEIHGMRRGLECALIRLRKARNVSAENKELILKFHDHCFSEGLSLPRVLFYMRKLPKLAGMLGKDFRQATREDIEAVVGKLERTSYSEWSKRGFKVTIKKFYKWLEGGGEDYPAKVKWLKTSGRGGRRLPEELLTKEEVRRLIEAAEHPRDKAIISVMYESGYRVGELATLKIKHISFDKYGAKLIVSGKTGMRRVRLIISVNHLATWLASHPLRKDPEAPLWVNIGTKQKGVRTRYPTIAKRLREAAEKADIKKRVNPHSFRHARATHLANKLTETQMNAFFGWVQGSNMPSTYVHLSGRDIDKALLRIHGMVKEKDEDGLVARPRCGKQAKEGSKFCLECGMPFDLGQALKADEERGEFQQKKVKLMKALEAPEVRELLAKKMAEVS